MSRIDEIRGRLHLLSRQEREDAVYLLDSLSTALGNESGLRKELGELVERWRRHAELAGSDALMAAPGSAAAAISRARAWAENDVANELEALLAKGGGK